MIHTKDDFVSAPVELRRNWERNKKLIDLLEPVDIAFEGIENFNEQKLNKNVSQGDTMKYLAENKNGCLAWKDDRFLPKRRKKRKWIHTFTTKC